MADETGINRMSLRFPADLFRQLEEKRFAERTTFQDVGLRLFGGWLNEGKSEGSITEDRGAGELTSAHEADYSHDIGPNLAKLLDRYGHRAVELLADAVLQMEEISLADRPAAPLPPLPEPYSETENHERMGPKVPRPRRAG